jgi:hypothetical protein
VRVTDDQVLALRAFLAFDLRYEPLTRQLAAEKRLAGYGELVYAAFRIAVRRRFGPAWTSAEVVRFVARVRINLRELGIDLEPNSAETLIRQALGDPVTSRASDDTHAQVLLFVLGELISGEYLDEAHLDAFMAEARMTADARLAIRRQEPFSQF